jgi:hypothetical protein
MWPPGKSNGLEAADGVQRSIAVCVCVCVCVRARARASLVTHVPTSADRRRLVEISGSLTDDTKRGVTQL